MVADIDIAWPSTLPSVLSALISRRLVQYNSAV